MTAKRELAPTDMALRMRDNGPKGLAKLRGIAEEKAGQLEILTTSLRQARENLKQLEKQWQEANLAHERAKAEYVIAKELQRRNV